MPTRREALAIMSASLAACATGAAALATPLSRAVPLDDAGIRVVENAWITMPDGAKLAARLFLPTAALTGVQPAGAVLEYLPYRKRDGYRYRDDVAGAFLAKNGIALIRVDIRGTGESDGAMIDEYMPIEQQDALAVIDWIAKQRWCNGNVGMRGISYGSFSGLQAAAKAPPALKAIVSTCGTELRYVDDVHYRGGCLIQDQFEWAMEWQVVMRAPPDPAIVGAHMWREMWRQRLEAANALTIAWNQHQTLDAFWKNGSIENYGAVKCAIFNVGGMQDCYVDSALRMMERAKVPQKALIGPWSHKWPGYPDTAGYTGKLPSDAANGNPGPGVDWLPEEVRWWRTWLMGERNGIMDEPQIWAFREDLPPGAVYPKDTPGKFVSEPQWPSPRIKPSVYYLNAGGLSAHAGDPVLLEHRTNLTIGFTNRQSDASGDPDTFWREQSGDDELCLTFDSAPLASAIDIMGQPVLHVRVRADKPVAKLCARLTEVLPDGTSHYVTYFVLNLTHRDSDETPTPLVPGQDYDVSLTGQFACYRFAAGSLIRIAVSETWWPVVWPSPECVTLHLTAGRSRLELPVRDSAATDPAPPFSLFRNRYAADVHIPEPYYAGRLHGVQVSGPPGRRTYSLEEGTNDVERSLVPGTGTFYGEAYRLRRVIREDDPNSAIMEAEAINTYERQDWNVRLRAWCRCTSTLTDFVCEETFEAWDEGKLIFTRKWEKTIGRVMV
jgi:putative CocE/NonD family hydrolase